VKSQAAYVTPRSEVWQAKCDSCGETAAQGCIQVLLAVGSTNEHCTSTQHQDGKTASQDQAQESWAQLQLTHLSGKGKRCSTQDGMKRA
jgi:hypothetical protein